MENLTENDPDIVHREYLEFVLHVYPSEMRNTIMDKINALEGKVDVVFLGCGICQSFSGVREKVRVPTVMLGADDCIGALLMPLEYSEEKKKRTGTWFASPGWAKKGLAGVIKELHLDA